MLTTSAVEKMKDHQFSLVLPSIGGVGSNVNLKQSIADYTTPMNPQYALDRRFKWQVGLSELSYSNTVYTISSTGNTITLLAPGCWWGIHALLWTHHCKRVLESSGFCYPVQQRHNCNHNCCKHSHCGFFSHRRVPNAFLRPRNHENDFETQERRLRNSREQRIRHIENTWSSNQR